jgi:hypothetical protein
VKALAGNRGGSTATISFSSDLQTLNYLEDYCQMKQVKRSSAIRYHIKMGRVYLKLLDEQQKKMNDYANGAESSQEKEVVAGDVED